MRRHQRHLIATIVRALGFPSVRQFCRSTGVSRSVLYRLASGKHVAMGTRKRLADTLGETAARALLGEVA